jgi:hypothetical protein
MFPQKCAGGVGPMRLFAQESVDGEDRAYNSQELDKVDEIDGSGLPDLHRVPHKLHIHGSHKKGLFYKSSGYKIISWEKMSLGRG